MLLVTVTLNRVSLRLTCKLHVVSALQTVPTDREPGAALLRALRQCRK